MFFILSTGRSGSNTIASTLSQMPNCTCVHEAQPVLIEESSAYRYGEVTPGHIRDLLRATRPQVLQGAEYGESNQTLSLVIPELVTVFPEAKFVWLVRNGLDVVASAVGRGWYPTDDEGWDALDRTRRRWVLNRVEGDRVGDVTKSQWLSMSTFERCCWYWSYINRLIERDLETYAKERFRTICLENFNRDLLGIARWIGLRVAAMPASEKLNRAKNYEVYRWQDWSTVERAQFNHWCGDLMDRFYPSWRNAAGTWKGVEYLPPTGLQRIARQMPRVLTKTNAAYALIASRFAGH